MRLPKAESFGAGLCACLLAFAAGVGCFLAWRHAGPPPAEQGPRAQATPRPAESNAPADAPAAHAPRGPIARIDFKNFTYPSSSAGRRVRVRGGELEYPTEPGCGRSFSVRGVDYLDFDGDGEDEALVRLIDQATCGSSWTSVNYFVYAVRGGRVRLLWDFATGSEAHGGEKAFRVEGREMVFELYGRWRAAGDGLVFEEDRSFPDDCCPTHFTVYRVAWDGRRFRSKSAEVFPYEKGRIN